MKKFSSLSLGVAFLLVHAGCVSSSWIKDFDLNENREATVCGKEIVQVPSSDDLGMTQPEYRVQITWNEVKCGTQPMLWSVVDEKTYQGINLGDRITLIPCNIGQAKGHATVIYMWADERTYEIHEVRYEFDLPYNPVR